MSFVQKITMTDAKVKFGSLSLNNQYQVHFAGINGAVINYLRFDKRINNAQDFISREAGILCNDASLPATAYATAEVKDCLLYTSPSPRDATLSRMPSSA